jgi:hypothetical protein
MPIWRNGTGNGLWGTAGNWDTGVVPTAALAGTDAIFDSLSPNCTVNITTAACRNLNFTGYTNTITMTNSITVGSSSSANPNHSVTLSPTMGVAGTGNIITRANGTTTLTSNGKTWPNGLWINNAFTAVNSIATLADNWVVGSLVLGPASNTPIIFNGAFTITVNGNFNIQLTGGSVSYIQSTAGSIPTIVLAGTGTWSVAATFATAGTSAIGLGVNVNINAPGQTVTIANNCYFGGAGSVANQSTFSYTAGTVVHSGNFYLLGIQTGPTYNINLNGSTSTSPSTTSSSGVNFDNLLFRTTASGNPQPINITGNVCVVNTLQVQSTAIAKGPINTIGGTIYANGNLTINGAVRNPSSTIVRLQGTGNWFENAFGTLRGVTWQIVINTTGVITLTSDVGLTDGATLTYTAGSFITTGYSIVASTTTFSGFGSGGILINSITHITGGAFGTEGARITFNDTVPFNIGTMTFSGWNTNFSHRQTGTIGYICQNFLYQLTSGAGVFSILLGLQAISGISYTVTNNLVFRHYSPTSGGTLTLGINTGNTIPRVIFTLSPGASQDVYAVTANNTDSTLGQTIWYRKGSIFNTLNWSPWDYPKTRHSTFISN